MKKITLLVALTFCLVMNAQSEMGKITFNKAVNISGKQRMLSQKMAKAYFYLLEFPTNEKAKKELVSSSIIFEKHNEILKKYSVSKETTNKLEEVDNLWKEQKAIYENTVNLSEAKIIISKNTALLKKTDEVVQSIIFDAEANSQVLSDDSIETNMGLKNIINTSGKQRMLAQRLALYYLANRADINTINVKGDLSGVYLAFENAITDLLLSEYNTEKIEITLSEAMKDWDELKQQKDALLTHNMSSEEIYNRTNNLTATFNKLTTLYEKVKLD